MSRILNLLNLSPKINSPEIKKLPRRILRAGIRIASKGLKSNSPDFMILGAQKCGTSSLHFYLNQHPNIRGSIPKELNYFTHDVHTGTTLAEYESNFKSFRKKMHFESTPSYMYYPEALELIKKAYPDIPVVVVLRDPVRRAFSAWNHHRQKYEHYRAKYARSNRPNNSRYEKLLNEKNEFMSFRECIDGPVPESAILRRGLYLQQLESCWNLFGREKVLIIGFEDLIASTHVTLDKVTEFVGAAPVDWNFLNPEPKNVRTYSAKLQSSDRAFLEEYYQEPNRRLFEEIGKINW